MFRNDAALVTMQFSHVIYRTCCLDLKSLIWLILHWAVTVSVGAMSSSSNLSGFFSSLLGIVYKKCFC